MGSASWEALAPGLAALGLCVGLLPWLDRRSTRARTVMVAITLSLMIHYGYWRITSTLPPLGLTLDWVFGVVFLVVETLAMLAAMISLVFLARTKDRSPEVERHRNWFGAPSQAPLIDVFICTYNEEEAILERTIIGALGLAYPNYRTWVLDDGRRPWLADLCARLDCGYITRPDNAHAKAGNINHALTKVAALDRPPDFISILDADFVVTPQFLSRAVALFHAGDVGIVQTPQHFINSDPIQANLSAADVWPDEQRFFFDVVMASKDAWSTAFCCGTSSVIRFAPLTAIGGFPTDSVTEDYLLTLRLKEIGYRTVYLNEPLTFGLAPEGLKEYITQRGRWCLGFMQIARGRSGPLSRTSRIGIVDRIALIDSFLNWTVTYPMKLISLIVPLMFFLFGIKMVNTGLSDALQHFLPMLVVQGFTMAWISAGRSLIVMSDVSQFVAAPAVLKAVAVGLLKPKGHKFAVTAKGGDRSHGFVEWPLLRLYGTLLVLTIAAIALSFYVTGHPDAVAYGALALGWSWYNVVVLAIVCAICVEQPRRRKSERFESDEPMTLVAGGRTRVWRLMDISITGARLKGEPPGPVGTTVRCVIDAQVVEARVVRILPGSFALHFDAELASRITLIQHFYARNYVKAFERVAAHSVGRAIVTRLLS
jgi:cellulose synthase (UDP-forming)